MRPIPTAAVEFIKDFEGVELKAYADIAGVWTIGWGHTKGVKAGQVISLATAEQYLWDDLEAVGRDLARTLKPDILAKLSDHQYAALLSFGFNLGVSSKDGIWGVVDSGQFDRVPARMQLYNKARVNGVLTKVRGLTRRRQAEAALWEEGQGEEVVLTAYAADTTPTPRDPVPAKKSATIWLAITAAVGGFVKWVTDLLLQIPEFAQTALSAINPFTTKSPMAEAIANGVGGLAAVAGIYVAWSVVKKKRENRS